LAFTVYIIVKENNATETIDGLKGIAQQNPFLVTALSIAMLSLAGIPPLAGFFGKFSIFSNALNIGNVWIVIVAVINSLLGVYYYLRVMVMSIQPVAAVVPKFSLPLSYRIILIAGILLLLVMGILPELVLGRM